MASDRIVTPRHVLASIMQLQRCGSDRILSELESLEPDLAEYLLERLTQLHHQMMKLGSSAKRMRQAYRLAESTCLVCLLALQKAHQELWSGGEESGQETEDRSPPAPPE